MFVWKRKGLFDFFMAALVIFAAAYHTPVGAMVRSISGSVFGVTTTTRPLLAYYSGGVYGTKSSVLSKPLPPPPATLATATSGEALSYALHASLGRLDVPRRARATALGAKFGRPKMDSPRDVAAVLAGAKKNLRSEDAAVVAFFTGYETARYASERVQAEGGELNIERLMLYLPPGFDDEVATASQVMMVATAYGLAWPVPASTPVTSGFGYRVHPTLGTKKLHTGLDLAVPEGSNVRATATGIIRRASEDGVNGRVLVIDHGRGVTTAYCHNSKLLVKVGDAVKEGQVVALSGNTGRSTGPHLHYQVELASSPVDPLLYRVGTTPAVADGHVD